MYHWNGSFAKKFAHVKLLPFLTCFLFIFILDFIVSLYFPYLFNVFFQLDASKFRKFIAHKLMTSDLNEAADHSTPLEEVAN